MAVRRSAGDVISPGEGVLFARQESPRTGEQVIHGIENERSELKKDSLDHHL